MGDESFRELSKVDPKADQLLDEVKCGCYYDVLSNNLVFLSLSGYGC